MPEPSRAALRALFDAALDAMIVVDGAARVVDANPAAARLRGEPREALIGRSIGEFSPPDVAERAAERWAQFLSEGVMIADDRGSSAPMARSARSSTPARRTTCRTGTSGSCATSPSASRASGEAQFQAELLDHVDAAVVAVDARGRVTHWNAAAERLYGVPRAEALGQPVADLVVAEGARGRRRRGHRARTRGRHVAGRVQGSPPATPSR